MKHTIKGESYQYDISTVDKIRYGDNMTNTGTCIM